MSINTLKATPNSAPAVRYYRVAVLILSLALTAMIASTVILSVRAAPAADGATTGVPSSSQVDTSADWPGRCTAPGVPC